MIKLNKYQKEVEKQLLEDEKQIIEELKKNYATALKDVKERIKNLSANELTQSKIYQKQYQENLEIQLKSIIDLLSSDNLQSISDYLEKTYQDGFIGTLYNMQHEGVPFIMPINQEAVVKSITKKTEDFKLSKTLYQNADELKKTIKSEITRGISKNDSYTKISQRITMHSEADFNKSYRIARTEGGRVQTEAKFECMKRAKANGADVVKEWDSTMDSRTRDTHVGLDGQIKELEEPFEIGGMKAMYPHGFGIASEDINCRCAVLERARWTIDDDESFTKNIDGNIVEFENVKDYQDYKQKYFDFYKKDDIILSNREVNQITEYTRFDATRINRAIRTENITEAIKEKINILDGIFDRVKPLKEDLILHRGTIIQSIKGFEKQNKVSHKEIMSLKDNFICDNAFISTSKEKAEEQGRNIIMKIKVNKGFKGAIDIEPYATQKYKYQKEVLLKRNTQFYVNDIQFKDGKYYLDVEVIE